MFHAKKMYGISLCFIIQRFYSVFPNVTEALDELVSLFLSRLDAFRVHGIVLCFVIHNIFNLILFSHGA